MIVKEFVYKDIGSPEYDDLPASVLLYTVHNKCESCILNVKTYFHVECSGPKGHPGPHEVTSGGGHAIARWYDTL